MGKTYTCPTGLLIAESEEGNYVPFLLKIREQDIMWDLNNVSEELRAVVSYSNPEEYNFIIPQPYFTINVSDWIVKLDQDYTFIASKTINLNKKNVINKVSSDEKVNSIYVKLPFKVLKQDLNIQVGMDTSDYNFMVANISVNISDTTQVDNFILNIVSEKILTINESTQASLMIHVRGKATM